MFGSPINLRSPAAKREKQSKNADLLLRNTIKKEKSEPPAEPWRMSLLYALSPHLFSSTSLGVSTSCLLSCCRAHIHVASFLFISPLQQLHRICSFACAQVGWERGAPSKGAAGPGSAFRADDPSITHHIVDRQLVAQLQEWPPEVWKTCFLWNRPEEVRLKIPPTGAPIEGGFDDKGGFHIIL